MRWIIKQLEDAKYIFGIMLFVTGITLKIDSPSVPWWAGVLTFIIIFLGLELIFSYKLSKVEKKTEEMIANLIIKMGQSGFDISKPLIITPTDELYNKACNAVVEAGKASTSYIQRKLNIGYSQAAELMDMLEKKGVIGPANGSKPRNVLKSLK